MENINNRIAIELVPSQSATFAMPSYERPFALGVDATCGIDGGTDRTRSMAGVAGAGVTGGVKGHVALATSIPGTLAWSPPI